MPAAMTIRLMPSASRKLGGPAHFVDETSAASLRHEPSCRAEAEHPLLWNKPRHPACTDQHMLIYPESEYYDAKADRRLQLRPGEV
jgi:hypothetical protein